jgi:hypothetical protein
MRPLTMGIIKRCQADDAWSLGNKVLYDMCRHYPRHASVSEVVAKVWLIGRAYSATVERGRGDVAGPGLSNDEFYRDMVAPALIDSDLDLHLGKLRNSPSIGPSSTGPVLAAHGCLVSVLSELTGKKKRSFASKYLHFHCPRLFFLYDSRAVNAIRVLGIRRRRGEVPEGVNAEYAKFVGTALNLRDRVAAQFGVTLSPRQLDRLLLLVDAG